MKKTLLAAALLAGFATAGVAQAETSVTLYGILDTGYGYNQVKYNKDGVNYKSTSSGMVNGGGIFNGNRWGLRGSEDLGDGLRAIFTLEQGFNLGTGGNASDSNQFHRQAWVGLTSDNWGTFTMGRQYNMGAKFVYDNFGVGHAAGDIDNAFGGIGYGNRMNNSFRYITPDFSGFSAGIAYGNGRMDIQRDSVTIGGNTYGIGSDRTNWLSIGAQYVNGPIAIGASYDRQTRNETSTGLSYDKPGSNAKDALTSWNLGASYDFEVAKLILVYGQDRHGKMAGGSAPFATEFTAANMANAFEGVNGYEFKSNNYNVAITAPIGAGTLAASWTRSKSNLDDSKALGSDAKAQDIYHLNYQYPLSKRTSVYAYGSYSTGWAYIDGMKAKEIGLGLNHKF